MKGNYTFKRDLVGHIEKDNCLGEYIFDFSSQIFIEQYYWLFLFQNSKEENICLKMNRLFWMHWLNFGEFCIFAFLPFFDFHNTQKYQNIDQNSLSLDAPLIVSYVRALTYKSNLMHPNLDSVYVLNSRYNFIQNGIWTKN